MREEIEELKNSCDAKDRQILGLVQERDGLKKINAENESEIGLAMDYIKDLHGIPMQNNKFKTIPELISYCRKLDNRMANERQPESVGSFPSSSSNPTRLTYSNRENYPEESYSNAPDTKENESRINSDDLSTNSRVKDVSTIPPYREETKFADDSFVSKLRNPVMESGVSNYKEEYSQRLQDQDQYEEISSLEGFDCTPSEELLNKLSPLQYGKITYDVNYKSSGHSIRISLKDFPTIKVILIFEITKEKSCLELELVESAISLEKCRLGKVENCKRAFTHEANQGYNTCWKIREKEDLRQIVDNIVLNYFKDFLDPTELMTLVMVKEELTRIQRD